jgi:Spy/CpxP family protein refolding chaperone
MSLNVLERPAQHPFWSSPKLAGALILVLVFFCGAVTGAVAHAMMHHDKPFWNASAKSQYLKTIQRQLDLTPEQTVQMESILDDFSKYYQTVLSDGKSRIINILNDEQKRKFEKMLKEHPRK